MINNLHDIGFFDAVHCLGLLIVIYKDHLLLAYIHESPPGDKAFKAAMPVQYGEVAELFLCHDFLDIFHVVAHTEGNQRRLAHKMLDRDALVDQPGCCKCIMRRADNDDASFFRLLHQFFRYLGSLADHQAAGINIYRAGLGFVPVPQYNQIILLNELCHQVRIGRSDRHLPLCKIAVLIAGDQGAVQGPDDILVLRLGF